MLACTSRQQRLIRDYCCRFAGTNIAVVLTVAGNGVAADADDGVPAEMVLLLLFTGFRMVPETSVMAIVVNTRFD